jgi:hypothetical protein
VKQEIDETLFSHETFTGIHCDVSGINTPYIPTNTFVGGYFETRGDRHLCYAGKFISDGYGIWAEGDNYAGVFYGTVGIHGLTNLYEDASVGGELLVYGDLGVGVSGGIDRSGLTIGENTMNQAFLTWRDEYDYLNIGTEEAGILYDNTLTVRTGQVGIGTGTPLQTLDVRGTIGNSGTVYHSDIRWKRDVRKLDGSLEKIMNLEGVQYEWKQDENPEMNFPDGDQIGLIAQDVEKIVPEVVNESADGYKSIDYARLVAVLIESVKEQQGQIETLAQRVEELEGSKLSGR